MSCRDVDGPRDCQSEVSQKEKKECPMLARVCGIWKDGTDDLTNRAEIEIQM